ncbi:FUSC family protein [Camelimonas sp. ID_303_24]
MMQKMQRTSTARLVSAGGEPERPNSWLRELARVKKSRWEVGHTLRGALAVGLPWAIALAIGAPLAAMWISYGAMRALSSETGGGYRTRFRTAIIAPILGMVGFLAGALDNMPWAVTVTVMTVFGFVAAVASAYSAQLSKATTHALLVAAITIGIPSTADYRPALLYFSGVVFYVALLGIEALCMHGRTRHTQLTALLSALGNLAACRALAPSGDQLRQPEVEEARRGVTTAFCGLNTTVIQAAPHHFRRGDVGARMAAVLARADASFVAITASQDRAALQVAATALRAAAAGEAVPPVASNDPVGVAINALLGALDIATAPAEAAEEPAIPHEPPRSGRFHVAIDQIAPTQEVLRSAASVALCLGIAYSARWLVGSDEHWYLSANHWYWIPLTVSIVMKPELGSVFARAILRIAGTIVGALVGVAFVLLIPNGVWLALPIAIFAGLMPTAAQRSYALLAAVTTPIILVFLRALEPVPIGASYAVLRIENTVIGGAIVLIFGYFIWPRTHFDRIASDFQRAKQRIADYIRATARTRDKSRDASLREARREAYRELMNLRTHLRAALAEPPPASVEAAAWFPQITTAERMCDHVTTYVAGAPALVSAADADALARLATEVASQPDAQDANLTSPCMGCSPQVTKLHGEIKRELQHLERLRNDAPFRQINPQQSSIRRTLG